MPMTHDEFSATKATRYQATYYRDRGIEISAEPVEVRPDGSIRLIGWPGLCVYEPGGIYSATTEAEALRGYLSRCCLERNRAEANLAYANERLAEAEAALAERTEP